MHAPVEESFLPPVAGAASSASRPPRWPSVALAQREERRRFALSPVARRQLRLREKAYRLSTDSAISLPDSRTPVPWLEQGRVRQQKAEARRRQLPALQHHRQRVSALMQSTAQVFCARTDPDDGLRAPTRHFGGGAPSLPVVLPSLFGQP